MRPGRLLLPPLLALLAAGCHKPAPVELLLVTTTSTQDSGLLDRLDPPAEKALGVHVKVIAVGSGEALKMAQAGNADVVLAHAPAAEEAVVASGDVVDRRPLMWNRFLLVGPAADPANAAGAAGDAVEAFRRIRAAKATFVSRGDQSGTDKKEKEAWKAAGLPPEDPSVKSTGQGMGETLSIAAQLGGYTLVDSSTWTHLHPPGLAALLDPATTPPPKGAAVTLLNPYHVMVVNPAKHPSTHAAAAHAFEEWLFSPQAAAIIGSGGLFGLGEPPAS
jgi:tungstate transport system substrate-binding protein